MGHFDIFSHGLNAAHKDSILFKIVKMIMLSMQTNVLKASWCHAISKKQDRVKELFLPDSST